MILEVVAPASLPLGLIRIEHTYALLGITLQHPPVDLFAQTAPALSVTGARADLARAQAERCLQAAQTGERAELEIELAIPNLMGLGSEAMLGLSAARALAELKILPSSSTDTPALAQAIDLEPEHALEVWSFHAGGLLLVDVQAGTRLRRHEIAHPDKTAWGVVMHFPRHQPDLSETLEADRLALLLNAAPHLSAETGRLLDEALWPALARDDLETFGRALVTIQNLNHEALARAGTPLPFSADEEAIFEIMRTGGCAGWGRSLTGLTRFGFIRGADPSVEVRRKLSSRLGFYGGVVMASICDNRGARHQMKMHRLC
ncbi:MAG: hypothetical protein ACRDH2_01615 [Anaerolineales bacterium]